MGHPLEDEDFDPNYEDFDTEEEFCSTRTISLERVMIMSKLERCQGQQNRWVRKAKRTLKLACEEFGHSPFKAEELEDSGALYGEDGKGKNLMHRLVVFGWYRFNKKHYELTPAGFCAYENLFVEERYPEEIEE